MSKFRTEEDSIGKIDVPQDAYWGAQTQRSIENFAIGEETMPIEFIHAYAQLKQAYALANKQSGVLDTEQFTSITKACQAIIDGELDDQFPLKIWQTGSGTQTNMNLNEVITNYANELTNQAKGSKDFVHPNDHVNACQSSNDTFPAAMHIALTQALVSHLLPSLTDFKHIIEKKIREFDGIIRVGRTHLQDAVPIEISQSFSAYQHFISDAIDQIHLSLDGLYELPIGATAVGTGLNSNTETVEQVIQEIEKKHKLPFCVSNNHFAALSGHQAIMTTGGHIASLAANLNKMANDIRLLGSGPRCGFGELLLPANEPGSSIMPGKVNPTQCEAMTMVCLQVMANQQLILAAGASGQLELNTYRPVIIYNILQSVKLLSNACNSFKTFLLKDLAVHTEQVNQHLEHSLMLITALKPTIGYDKCAEIAHYAHDNDTTLKEATIKLGHLSAEEYDQLVNPKNMV